MTLEDLKTEMAKLGFKWQAQGNDLFEPGFFWKPIATGQPRTHNDRDQLVVHVADYSQIEALRGRYPHDSNLSLTTEICGEFPLQRTDSKHWAKLQIYGLTPTEFFAALLQIQGTLIRAWDSLAEPATARWRQQ